MKAVAGNRGPFRRGTSFTSILATEVDFRMKWTSDGRKARPWEGLGRTSKPSRGGGSTVSLDSEGHASGQGPRYVAWP